MRWCLILYFSFSKFQKVGSKLWRWTDIFRTKRQKFLKKWPKKWGGRAPPGLNGAAGHGGHWDHPGAPFCGDSLVMVFARTCFPILAARTFGSLILTAPTEVEDIENPARELCRAAPRRKTSLKSVVVLFKWESFLWQLVDLMIMENWTIEVND